MDANLTWNMETNHQESVSFFQSYEGNAERKITEAAGAEASPDVMSWPQLSIR